MGGEEADEDDEDDDEDGEDVPPLPSLSFVSSGASRTLAVASSPATIPARADTASPSARAVGPEVVAPEVSVLVLVLVDTHT